MEVYAYEVLWVFRRPDFIGTYTLLDFHANISLLKRFTSLTRWRLQHRRAMQKCGGHLVLHRLPSSLYLLIFLESKHIANQCISGATCVNQHEVETGRLQQSAIFCPMTSYNIILARASNVLDSNKQ